MNQQLRVVACLLACGAAGFATTYSNETTAALAIRATQVCCVRCERVEPQRDPRSNLVFSIITLRVLETIAGTHRGPTLKLRLIGGRADGVETRVAGMPKFRVGGECVLLLGKKNRAGFPVVLQAARGAIPLRASKNGVRYVESFVTGFSGLRGPRMTLDTFRAAVKNAVRQAQKKAARAKAARAKSARSKAATK